MNSFNLFNKVKITTPHASADFYYGTYTSLAEAKAGVPVAVRELGRTVGVVTTEGGVTEVKEYWWKRNKTDDGLVQKGTENHSELLLNDGSNPHNTTQSDVGLPNVDNTSDANKPISVATQDALDDKVTIGSIEANDVALDDTNLKVSKKTDLQAFAEGIDDAVLKNRGTGVSSSYVSSVVVGGTVFSQGIISGEINSDEGYVKTAIAEVVNETVLNLNARSTFVYIDKNNELQQQTTEPTREDWTRKVFTMRILVDTSSNTIINFEYYNNPIGNYANSIRDFFKYLRAAGIPFKLGMAVTGRTDNLGFDVEEGSFLEFGGTGNIFDPSTKSLDQVDNAEYFLLTKTNIDPGGNTNIVKFWDNNDTITPLGSTTCVGHRLYRDSFGTFFMQYGQENYANMTLCKAGVKLEEYILNPTVKTANFLGWWLIESTATATAGTVNAQFMEYTIGPQGGISSNLSGAFLIGNHLSEVLDAAAARSNLGIDTVLEDFQIKSEEQEVIIGGVYDNFQVEGNIIVATNTDGKAVFTGFNISEDYKIIYLINNSDFEIQIDNESSSSLEENQIKLPNGVVNVGLQGTTVFAYITKGGLNKWQIIDVFGSRYMPEHKDLTEDAVVVVGENSVSGSKQIVNLYDSDPSITSATLTDAELNIRVPGRVIGFELICENAGDNGIVYKLVNDTTGVWKKFILT